MTATSSLPRSAHNLFLYLWYALLLLSVRVRPSVYLNNLFDRKLDLRWSERGKRPKGTHIHPHKRCYMDGLCDGGCSGLLPSLNATMFVHIYSLPTLLICEPSLVPPRSMALSSSMRTHTLSLSLSLSCSSLLPWAESEQAGRRVRGREELPSLRCDGAQY